MTYDLILASILVYQLMAGDPQSCVSMCVCHLHVDMWRLEAALVDVVVCEGLCGVGAVLVHRDGHFAMSHPSAVWT